MRGCSGCYGDYYCGNRCLDHGEADAGKESGSVEIDFVIRYKTIFPFYNNLLLSISVVDCILIGVVSDKDQGKERCCISFSLL